MSSSNPEQETADPNPVTMEQKEAADSTSDDEDGYFTSYADLEARICITSAS